MDVLYGLHPVEEAVRSASRRLERVLLARERGDARAGARARLVPAQVAIAIAAGGLRAAESAVDELRRIA